MSLGKIIDKKNNDLSKRIDKQKIPEHVAIIMDGNGRWATKKGTFCISITLNKSVFFS